MKKVFLLIIPFLMFSCSTESAQDCNQKLQDAENQYIQALSYCGGSLAAMNKVTSEYQAKKQQIMNDCK